MNVTYSVCVSLVTEIKIAVLWQFEQNRFNTNEICKILLCAAILRNVEEAVEKLVGNVFDIIG